MAERARFYRYGGIVVRLRDGRLEPVIRGGRVMRARRGLFPTLPADLRHAIRQQADDLDRRARLREQGVELPDTTPQRADALSPFWTDLSATAAHA